MREINVGATWRGLNENLALPISLIALGIAGATYLGERQDAAEARAINQSVVWRSAPLEGGGGVKLVQPNEAVAIQRVEFAFPTVLRDEPISQPPSRLEIHAGWLEAGMTEMLKDCASPNMTTVVFGNVPVNVTTYFSVAGRNQKSTDTYTMHFAATVGEHGVVKTDIESVAIVARTLATPDQLMAIEGTQKGCLGRGPRAELQRPDPGSTN